MNTGKKFGFAVPVIHVMFWLIIILLQAVFLRATNPNTAHYSVMFAITMVGLVLFYLYYFTSLQWFYASADRKKLGWTLGVTIIILVAFDYWMENMYSRNAYVLFSSIAIVLLFSVCGMMMRGFQHTSIQRQQEQLLRSEKLDLELDLIRSQLNPHFLFNVLNNIDHYVRKDPEKASAAIIQLSSLMRYILYDSARARVPITSEVTFIDSYIDLQKQRMQNPQHCTFRTAIGNPGADVAPAIYLPFLENAFIHSALNETGAFVTFDLQVSQRQIRFSAINSKKMAAVAAQEDRRGLGLQLARKRLEILYPARHTLNIFDTALTFIVEVTIEYEET